MAGRIIYDDGKINVDDCIVKWTIQDIFCFPRKPNIEISSPTFRVAEIKWRLRVFPCGRKMWGYDTSDWFGISLCACGPHNIFDNDPFRISFSIIGKTNAINSVPERRNKWYIAEKIMKSKELKSMRKEIAPDGTLNIVCDIQYKKLAKSETESDDEQFVDADETHDVVGEVVSLTEPDCVGSNQAWTSPDANSGGQSPIQGSAEEMRDNNASTHKEPETDFNTQAYAWAGTHNGEDEHTEINCANVLKNEKHLSSLPKGIAKALQDYKELLLSQMHCNITINVGNKQFKAHKNILAARTPVFAAMLKHNMREKATGVVTIEDMDPETFPDFLEYLYTGQVQNLSSGNVLELFRAADKYQVKELREECIVYMKQNLSVENFCGIISVSLRYHEKELIALATQFFIENAVEIVKTCKWQTFMSENSVAANELFIKQLEFNNQNKYKQSSEQN